MSDDIFISYSRKDQEFVTRLASDLDAKVTGVWFDQSDIQAGQRWRDAIEQGVRNCKVVILVLSPDSVASPYVQMEINWAQKYEKRIVPILYRPARLAGSLDELVRQTQYIDLSRGSYADNFQTLVDGLIAAGAARQVPNVAKPFLRQAVPTNWGAVFGKIPGWGLAWGVGWVTFGVAVVIVLRLVTTSSQSFDNRYFLVFPAGGIIGGLVGGLVAGFITMLALRRFAPSINWKHMSPAIRIWAFTSPVGFGLSIGLMLLVFNPTSFMNQMMKPNPSCGSDLGCTFGGIFVQGLVGGLIAVLVIGLLVLLFISVIWFLTGFFSGWLAVRHIRRLEPGISRTQSGCVMLAWGLGALIGILGTLLASGFLSQVFGLTH